MNRLLSLFILLCLPMAAWSDDLRWQRTGPVAGTIDRILPDRGHPGVFYLLQRSNTDYYRQDFRRSIDNGQTWERIPMPGLVNVMVHSASSELFVVRRGRDYYKYDLMVSKDQGRTFQLRSGHAPAQIFDHPANPKILWGSGLSNSDHGLSVSYDGGAHWRAFTNLPYKFGKEYEVAGMKLEVDSYELQSVLVSPLDPKTVYVSTVVEFYVACGGESISLELASTNDGNSWASAESAPASYLYDPAFPDRAFSINYEGARVLTPAGWKQLFTPAHAIVSVPGRPDLLYGLSGTKQWISHDGGSHWNRTNIGPGGNAGVVVARSYPAGTLLAGTSGGGLYIIDETRNAHQVTKGFDDARVADVATAPRSPVVYAVTSNADSFLYRSLNSGITWTNITDRLARAPNRSSSIHVIVNPRNGRHVLFAVNDGIQISLDAGQTWSDAPQEHLIGAFFNPQSGTVYFSKAAHNRLYQSSDGGLTLQELPAEFGSPKNTIRDVEVDPFNGDLYVATDHGLYVSRDEGRTAVQIATDVNPDCLTCVSYQQIVVLPARGQYLAVAGGSIYKSVNQGVTWKLLPGTAGTIYVADDKGQHLFMIGQGYPNGGRLFESFDGGQSWDPKSATVDPRLAPNTYNYITGLTDPRYRPLYLSSTVGMYRAED